MYLDSAPVWNFRAHLSAAPLKIEEELRDKSVIMHFRAHLSAAPLKNNDDRAQHTQFAGFPRSSERGPIEDI